MSDFTPRQLADGEFRAANDLFRATLHIRPAKDEEWARSASRSCQPGRVLGVFDGDELIGTARSSDAEIALPGGGRTSFAAVTGVGVRPDRTRRGVLSSLMRTQLTSFAERGVPIAGLYASEGAIYGRFGYGIATTGIASRVDVRRARLHDGVPRGGEIELVFDLDRALDRAKALFDSLPPHGPGWISRSSYWWAVCESQLRRVEQPVIHVIHHGENGPDGYAVYYVDRDHARDTSVLHLQFLHAADATAKAGLWRYLLSVDLVEEIKTFERPADEDLGLLLTDPRAVQATAVEDELWLRLVDVEAALAAREWGPGELTVEVSDPVLAANSGTYRIAEGKAGRADGPGQLRLGVTELAMLYLGTWSARSMVRSGRAAAPAPETVEIADQLFATRAPAWCGTFF